jgi:hypothetical protein
MLKFLAILFIISYVTYKFGGFIMRTLYTVMGQDPTQRNFNNQSQKKSGSDINIDYVPKDKKAGNSTFKGGEYVDYEEVK